MSYHIGAKDGEVAETVLLPGDPLRAQFIAENFLEDIYCYSKVRGMYGFSGVYQGKKVSVQGAGMGLPSTSIYVNELINFYRVKTIVRVGTCGSIHTDIGLGEKIIALGASTDSSVNRVKFNGQDFAPTADFDLLQKVNAVAGKIGMDILIGGIYSTDSFYLGNNDRWKVWSEHGVLGVEMESTALYTLAVAAKVRALSILMVSDNIITGKTASGEEREKGIREISKLALETIITE